jgi:exportin-2 (importin alpha re-exporter)
MIALSTPADKALRAQVAETVSLVAQQDFPTQWPTLIDVRLSYISTTRLSVSNMQPATCIFPLSDRI